MVSIPRNRFPSFLSHIFMNTGQGQICTSLGSPPKKYPKNSKSSSYLWFSRETRIRKVPELEPHLPVFHTFPTILIVPWGLKTWNRMIQNSVGGPTRNKVLLNFFYIFNYLHFTNIVYMCFIYTYLKLHFQFLTIQIHNILSS